MEARMGGREKGFGPEFAGGVGYKGIEPAVDGSKDGRIGDHWAGGRWEWVGRGKGMGRPLPWAKSQTRRLRIGGRGKRGQPLAMRFV
jgi:hypothetical protein